MAYAGSISSCANRLLAALPPEESRRVSNLLTAKPLTARQRLHRRGEPLREIYFPSRSLCSLVATMDDGGAAEITVVGSEGLIGVEAVLGLPVALRDVTVQVTGDGVAHAMTIEAFRQELDRREAFYDRVMKYTQAFLGLVTQSAACNGLHSAEARCCRWLLHAQDRLETNELPLTHELLATTLAVRRPTVTLIISNLVQEGIISNGRGVIRIIDRAALEARSCECHKTVKALFDNLFAHERPTRHTPHGEMRWPEPIEFTG